VTRRFVITAVGDDRPGIVAAVTGALLELEANLEDTAMTLLEGQFAMVLVIALPGGDANQVRHALDSVTHSFGLMVDVRESVTQGQAATGRQCALTVYGADHPGIVHRVTAVLAQLGVNVVDLATRVIGRDNATPVYAMLLDLSVPDALADDVLRSSLDEVAGELGVDCTLRAVDADIL
jgi:glycine cleavage system transcriptional repressor